MYFVTLIHQWKKANKIYVMTLLKKKKTVSVDQYQVDSHPTVSSDS